MDPHIKLHNTWMLSFFYIKFHFFYVLENVTDVSIKSLQQSKSSVECSRKLFKINKKCIFTVERRLIKHHFDLIVNFLSPKGHQQFLVVIFY